MSRAILAALFVAITVGATVLVGCPAAHDGYPGLACMKNEDCFKGETCQMNVCMPVPPDLAVDAASPFDFSRPPDLAGLDFGDDL